jgi:hypothetical protein
MGALGPPPGLELGVPAREIATEVEVIRVSADSIRITWYANLSHDDLVLERAIPGGLFRSIASVTGANGTVYDTLAANSGACFRLASNQGDRPPGPVNCLEPGSPIRQITIEARPGAALIRWQTDAEIDSLALWRAGTNTHDNARLVARSSGDEVSFLDTAVSNDTLQYWIVPYQAGRWGNPSQSVRVYIPAKPNREVAIDPGTVAKTVLANAMPRRNSRPDNQETLPVPRVVAQGSARMEVRAKVGEEVQVERRVSGREGVFSPVGRLGQEGLFVDEDPILMRELPVEYRLAPPALPELAGPASAPLRPLYVPPRIESLETESDRSVRIRLHSDDPSIDHLRLYRRPLAGPRLGAQWTGEIGIPTIPSHLTWADLISAEDGSESLVAELEANDTLWVDEGLELGARVTYRLESYRSGRLLAQATSPQAITLRLSPPADLRADIGPGARVALTWRDACSYETGYLVFRDSGGGMDEIAELPRNTTAWVDTMLVGQGPWRYAVATLSTTGSSPRSEAAIVAADVQPPRNLCGRLQGGALLLHWSPPAGTITGYDLQQRVGTTASYATIALLPPNQSSYEDHNLSFGQDHRYQVRTLGLTLRSVPSQPYLARLPNPFIDGVSFPLPDGRSGWIARRAVTRAEYRLYAYSTSVETPKSWRSVWEASLDDDQPATGLTWIEVTRYLDWVSDLAGLEPYYGAKNGSGHGGVQLPNADLWRAATATPVTRQETPAHKRGEQDWAKGLKDNGYFGVYSPPLRGESPLSIIAVSPPDRPSPADQDAPNRHQSETSIETAQIREWLDDPWAPEGKERRWRIVAGGGPGGDPDTRAATLLFPYDPRVHFDDLGFRMARIEREGEASREGISRLTPGSSHGG